MTEVHFPVFVVSRPYSSWALCSSLPKTLGAWTLLAVAALPPTLPQVCLEDRRGERTPGVAPSLAVTVVCNPSYPGNKRISGRASKSVTAPGATSDGQI